jgi:N-methylhydantoinase B
MTASVSPVVVEVIRNRLHAINEEAATTLKRVSGSPIATESNDLNTVVTTASGAVVACGHYVLCQVASMNLVIEHLLAEYATNPGIGPGDQFMTNDPYLGTLHQPDVVVVAPIFHDRRLVAWCGSVVHQMDVGGPVAGGLNTAARSIFDEPMPMPPLRVVEGGVVRRDIEREYLRRSRTPEMNALDLAGQFAANQAAAAQVQQLCTRYGVDVMTGVMDRLVDAAERRTRERLAALPDGRWRHVAHVEYGDEAEVYAIRLTATKRGDDLELDFSASDDQAPGAINAGYGALVNYTIGTLLVHLCAGVPWVPGGIARAVRIVSREGTVVHARWPSGVAMATGSTVHAIRACVNACVARMLQGAPGLLQHSMAACQSAGAGGGVLSGQRADGTTFASMTFDEMTGGGGARGMSDGLDTSGFTTSPGAVCANIEVNEAYLPVLYTARRELTDSGGPGRYRGGVGALHALRPHGAAGPLGVVSFGQGLLHPCATGIGGGDAGGGSLFALVASDAAASVLDGADPPAGVWPVARMELAEGMTQIVATQGGGGFGDPIERDPARVAADVAAGLVSPAAALTDYAVVLAGTDGTGVGVDLADTQRCRDERRRARLGGREPAPPQPSGGRRFDDVFDIVGDDIACARCSSTLCAVGQPITAHLLVDERPAASRTPLGFRFAGSEHFVLRALLCPHCARQLDVQIARTTDPVVDSVEPLPGGRRRDGGAR